jgi:hypothetical protein
MLGWDWFRFNKKRIGRRYAKLVFLHLVGAAAHVVHSILSVARNIKLMWTGMDSTKCGTHYTELVFLHPV